MDDLSTRTPAPHTANTLFLVLCGGQGVRMGGTDKPLLAWRGQPMVDQVLNSVPASMAKLISANRNLECYRERAGVLEDAPLLQRHDISTGPLVGILAGLEALEGDSEQEWLLVSPGDTPCLPSNWWQTMLNTADSSHSRAVVAFDGKRQQHLHLLLHQGLREALLAYLEAGHIAVFQWLQQIDAQRAIFDDPAAFRNINQPADLEE